MRAHQERFIEILKADGWLEVSPFTFQKGEWEITFDTSSWMQLGTKTTPRIFDVAVPQATSVYLGRWTLNLIDHLFTTNDLIESMKSPAANIGQGHKYSP
ncbi:MAG: hypothetical protein ACPGSI_05515 [Pikeienuella sp.]